MIDLPKLISWEVIVLIAGYFGIIFWKILTRRIRLECLLYGDDAQGNTSFSPGRAQMLVVTIIVALQYLVQVISHPTKFPTIPEFWVVALGGSHAVYLGAKAWSIRTGAGEGSGESGE